MYVCMDILGLKGGEALPFHHPTWRAMNLTWQQYRHVDVPRRTMTCGKALSPALSVFPFHYHHVLLLPLLYSLVCVERAFFP